MLASWSCLHCCGLAARTWLKVAHCCSAVPAAELSSGLLRTAAGTTPHCGTCWQQDPSSTLRRRWCWRVSRACCACCWSWWRQVGAAAGAAAVAEFAAVWAEDAAAHPGTYHLGTSHLGTSHLGTSQHCRAGATASGAADSPQQRVGAHSTQHTAHPGSHQTLAHMHTSATAVTAPQ